MTDAKDKLVPEVLANTGQFREDRNIVFLKRGAGSNAWRWVYLALVFGITWLWKQRTGDHEQLWGVVDAR